VPAVSFDRDVLGVLVVVVVVGSTGVLAHCRAPLPGQGRGPRNDEWRNDWIRRLVTKLSLFVKNSA
jgi:hypothetical protein